MTYGLARYGFGLFLPDIRASFSLSEAEIGWVASASYAGYLMATFAGSWLSTLAGPRPSVVLGGILASGGMLLIGIAADPLTLTAGVFIAGISPGLAYPPFSDVVSHHVSIARRETVYAWVNSGTGFGVLASGAVAMRAGSDWRFGWIGFAVVAIAVTAWNWRTLPPRRKSVGQDEASSAVAGRRLDSRAVPLLLSAFVFGIVTSIYWTFAVDLIRSLDGRPRDTTIFWIVLGAAGIVGCLAGNLSRSVGLVTAYRILTVLVGLAVAGLPVLATSIAGLLLSGAFFGAGFILATALYGMWSMRIFTRTPSIGFGATFFLISLGQAIGPVAAGYAIVAIGRAEVFVAAGLLCIALAPLGRGRSIPELVATIDARYDDARFHA